MMRRYGNLHLLESGWIDRPYQDHRPIFFVAHSLGGLVCEDVGILSCSIERIFSG